MHYNCSSCRRAIGVMLNKDGVPQSFECPYTKQKSWTVPLLPVSRKTKQGKVIKNAESSAE